MKTSGALIQRRDKSSGEIHLNFTMKLFTQIVILTEMYLNWKKLLKGVVHFY